MDAQKIQKLVHIACKQIDVAQQFKKPRIDEIQKSEDMYANKVKKQLKNRFNIPLPVLGGFVDTLKSKIDDAPVISYKEVDEADYKRAKKISALWQVESSDAVGRWAFTDRMVKTMAIFSGRGIYKYYASSANGYESNLEGVDYYDFLCEPQGGSYVERHLFCGQQNIFKTIAELEDGAGQVYDAKGVMMIKNKQSDSVQAKTQEESEQKFNRFKSLNLDATTNNYVGENIANLTEWYMVHEGKRYYLLFDPHSKIAVRAEELKDVFESDLYPFVSWATHEDPYNFWSKAPVDDIRPVADSMRVIFNQALDNVQKRNWGMRAFSTEIFKDPSKLAWRPDGLVPVTGSDPKRGIYEFQTPDNTQIVVNLFDYLDNFLGQKSGITPSTQGASDKDAKVGVYYGDLQQVADRLGLYNKAYKESWADLGVRYRHGLREHMTEKKAVKIIGNKGVEFADVLNEDVSIEVEVAISGGSAEVELDEVKKKRQTEVLDRIMNNPNFATIVNQKWLLENLLRSGEFEEDEVKKAMDNEMSGSAELMSEAAESIQMIVNGKKPEINRGATTGFIRKIIDFAYDKSVDLEVVTNLVAYAMEHVAIADENARRNFMLKQTQAQQENPQMGGATPPPVPQGSPQGDPTAQQGLDQGRSADTSQDLRQ